MNEALPQPAQDEAGLQRLESLQAAIQLLQSFYAELKQSQGVCREQARQLEQIGVEFPMASPVNSFTQAVTRTNLDVALESIDEAVERKQDELATAAVEQTQTYIPVIENAIEAAEKFEAEARQQQNVICELHKRNLAENSAPDKDAYVDVVQAYSKNFNALTADLLADTADGLQRRLVRAAFGVPMRLRTLLDKIQANEDLPEVSESENWLSAVENLHNTSMSATHTVAELVRLFVMPSDGSVSIHAPIVILATPTNETVQQLSVQEVLDQLKTWFAESKDQNRVDAVVNNLREIHDIVLAAATYRVMGYGPLLKTVESALQAGYRCCTENE